MTSVLKKDSGRSSIPVNKELNNGKIIYIYIYIYIYIQKKKTK